MNDVPNDNDASESRPETSADSEMVNVLCRCHRGVMVSAKEASDITFSLCESCSKKLRSKRHASVVVTTISLVLIAIAMIAGLDEDTSAFKALTATGFVMSILGIAGYFLNTPAHHKVKGRGVDYGPSG